MVTTVQHDVLSDVMVRSARPQDRAALLAMYREFEPKGAALGLPPLREEQTERWLDRLAPFPNVLLWSDERVVGHGAICPDGDSAEVAVFVHQDYRGLGFGRRLLNELTGLAMQLGLRRVWGIAETDNVPMLRLAYSCGFIPGDEMGEFYRLLP